MVLLTILGVISFTSISKFDEEVTIVISEDIGLLEMYNKLALYLAERRAIYRDFMLNPQDTSVIEDFKKYNNESRKIAQALLKDERAKEYHDMIKASDEWGDATKDITNLVRAIQEETDSAVDEMNVGARRTETTISLVKSTGTTLQNILRNIDTIIAQITEIASGIQQITINSHQIAASTEEQFATVEQMAASAGTLSQMANSLRSIVEKYRI